jgi:hypothetical protein
MKFVDEDTRLLVRNTRLEALEADNYGVEAEQDPDAAGDELYVDDDDLAQALVADKKIAKGRRRAASGSSARQSKRFKVKSLAQLVFEEVGDQLSSQCISRAAPVADRSACVSSLAVTARLQAVELQVKAEKRASRATYPWRRGHRPSLRASSASYAASSPPTHAGAAAPAFAASSAVTTTRRAAASSSACRKAPYGAMQLLVFRWRQAPGTHSARASIEAARRSRPPRLLGLCPWTWRAWPPE